MTPQPLLFPILRCLFPCAESGEVAQWAHKRRVSRAAYFACSRGDWMLRLAARVGVDHKLVVLAACDCAELALPHVPAGENGPREAIGATRNWCRGAATLEQLRLAEAAVYAARGAVEDAGSAVEAAAWAARDTIGAAKSAAVARAAKEAVGRAGDVDGAIRAAECANEAGAWAASVVRAVLAAAARSAGPDGAEVAGDAALKRCAQLIRHRIPFEMMCAALLAVEVSV